MLFRIKITRNQSHECNFSPSNSANFPQKKPLNLHVRTNRVEARVPGALAGDNRGTAGAYVPRNNTVRIRSLSRIYKSISTRCNFDGDVDEISWRYSRLNSMAHVARTLFFLRHVCQGVCERVPAALLKR